MAAELAQLIVRHEAQGLSEAAQQLRVVQTGLQAHGLLPASLEWIGQMGEPAPQDTAVGRSSLEASVQRRVLRIEDGWLRISDERLSTQLPHHLDVLSLSSRVRTALIQAGCSTVADVQFLIEQVVLERVRNIGPIGAAQVSERLHRWASTQHQESTMSRLSE